MRYWGLRILVLLLLALVVWLAGPRALSVLAHRMDRDSTGGPQVDLDRVAMDPSILPAWLQRNPALLMTVMAELSPRLQGKVDLLDESQALQLKARLQKSPWVRRVKLERRPPRGFRVSLALHRPVLQVKPAGLPSVLVSEQGVCLPLQKHGAEALNLPCTVLSQPFNAQSDLSYALGQTHPDPRVLAAARVVVEWQRQLRPLVPEAPALVEVDASNLGYRFLAERKFAEVLVGLRRQDGEVVYLSYGHPPGTPLTRVGLQTKAQVLKLILEYAPGLKDLQGGDLRFINHWRDWLLPRPGFMESGR